MKNKFVDKLSKYSDFTSSIITDRNDKKPLQQTWIRSIYEDTTSGLTYQFNYSYL